MSFEPTPNGTRGGRIGSGVVYAWINRRFASGAAKNSGKTMGLSVLALTTVGRKSGQKRTVPVGWFPDGDGRWLVVASASGAAINPAWYLNIAAHPDQVEIEMSGRKTAVTAEQLHGPERDTAWRQITAAAPRYTLYEHKTDRHIPIIRLTARPTSSSSRGY